MEWVDEAIILGVRRHGETSVIAELMTRERGRHLGLVQGGRSKTQRPLLQPGNSVRAVWRARLEDHLGQFKLEGTTFRAAHLMENAIGAFALQTLAGHLRLLPERDAHTGLYEALLVVLDNLAEPEIAAELIIRFELALLEELGFGLDLKTCAATGTTNQLIYVSPKSGRAVSREAGEPYADKMLVLPAYLRNDAERREASASRLELEQGLKLTEYFLDRQIYSARGLVPSVEREGLVRALLKALDD